VAAGFRPYLRCRASGRPRTNFDHMSTSEHTWKSSIHRTPVGVREWRVSDRESLPPQSLVLHPAYRGLVAFGTLGMLLVVCWLLLMLIQGPPTSHVVMIGVTEYGNDLIPLNDFGRQDMEGLERGLSTINRLLGRRQFALRATGGREDESDAGRASTGSDNNISSESYTRVFEDLNRVAGMGRCNVLVFCSLHARVDSAGQGTCRLMFLNADGNSSTGEVSLKELLSVLAKLNARHVFLFIDANRLTSDWKLGVLSNQFSNFLKAEVAKIDADNLTVICAAAAGQRSWTDERLRMSTFFRSTLDALSGDADGWAGGSRDNVVDSEEMFTFVHKRVEDWVWKNRGEPQTVERLGSAANIPLAVNVGGQQRLLAAAAEQQAADQAASEKPEEQKADAKTEQPDAAGKAESVAEADAADSKAATGEKAEKVEAPDQPGKAQARARLRAVWKLRDAWWADGSLAVSDPAVWRHVQVELLRCQEQYRHAEFAAVIDRLEQLEDRVSGIGGMIDGRWIARSESRWPVGLASLVWPARQKDAADAAPEPDPDPEDAKRREQLIAMVDDWLQAAADKLPDLAPLRRMVRDQPDGVDLLISEIHQRALQPGNCRRPAVERLKSLVDLIPQSKRPASLVFLSRFSDLRGGDGDPQQAELDGMCRDVLEQRLELERLLFELLRHPELARHIAREFGVAVRELKAAQRWLLLTDGRVPIARNLDDTAPKSDYVRQHVKQCREHVANTRELFNQVREAVRLRARILSELPALAVWKARVAEADPSRGFPPPDSNQQDLLAVWKAAAGHRDVLAPLQARDGKDITLFTREIAKQNGSLRARFQGVREVWENELRELIAADLQAVDWQRIDRALRSPWIQAEDREQLVDLRQSGSLVVSGADRATLDDRDTTRRVPGMWQGWWAIQALNTSGRDTETLLREWQVWKDKAASETRSASRPTAESRLAGLRLADGIRRELQAVVRDVTSETPDPAADRLLHIAGLTEERLGRVRSDVGDQDGVLRLLEVFRDGVRGDLDSRKQSAGSPLADYQRRYNAMLRRIDRDIDTSESEPKLTGTLQRGKDQNGKDVVRLKLELDGLDGQDKTPVRTVALCTIASLNRQGRSLSDAGDTVLDQVPGSYGLTFSTQTADVPQADLTVAVLDVATRVPLAIWCDELQQPSAPDKWRVVFRAENDPLDPKLDSRNQHPVPRHTVVTLPTSGEQPHVLQAYLIKPAVDSSVNTVAVSMWARDVDGQRRGKPLAENVRVDVSGESEQLRLIAFPAAAAAAPAATSNAKAPQGTDLANGVVLQIKPLEPLSKPGFEYDVLFDVLRPLDYLKQEPVLRFEEKQLSVAVERRSGSDSDVLLPEAIPIRLRLPGRVDKQRNDQSLLEQSLTAEDPAKTVYASFSQDVINSLNRRKFEVLLDVGGVPHAFRWEDVRPGSRGQLQRGDARWCEIIEPIDRAIFDGKAEIPLRVKLDGSDLRVPLVANSEPPWKLSYRLSPAGSRNDPTRSISGKKAYVIYRPRRAAFQLLGLAEGVWQVQVAVDDFVWPNVRPTQTGTFILDLTLKRGDTTVSRDSRFVIDSTSPTAETIGEIRRKVNVREQTLDFQLKAQDPQSGLQEVIAVFDLDNDRKIGEDERRNAEDTASGEDGGPFVSYGSPLENGKGRALQETIKVPLPEQSDKTYRLLLQVTNGAGTPSELIHADVKVMPAIVAVEVRTQIAQKDRYDWTVLDETGKPSVHAPPRKSRMSPQTFLLPVGKYTFKVNGRRAGFTTIAITDKDWRGKPLGRPFDRQVEIAVSLKK